MYQLFATKIHFFCKSSIKYIFLQKHLLIIFLYLKTEWLIDKISFKILISVCFFFKFSSFFSLEM